MILHRRRKAVARLDFGLYRFQRRREFPVLLRGRQKFKALDKRHSGVDHHGKLPRKHGNVLLRRISTEFKRSLGGFLFLRLDQKDLFAPKRERECLPAIGRAFPRDRFTLPISCFK